MVKVFPEHANSENNLSDPPDFKNSNKIDTLQERIAAVADSKQEKMYDELCNLTYRVLNELARDDRIRVTSLQKDHLIESAYNGVLPEIQVYNGINTGLTEAYLEKNPDGVRASIDEQMGIIGNYLIVTVHNPSNIRYAEYVDGIVVIGEVTQVPNHLFIDGITVSLALTSAIWIPEDAHKSLASGSIDFVSRILYGSEKFGKKLHQEAHFLGFLHDLYAPEETYKKT